MTHAEKYLLTKAEVATMLGISTKTVEDWSRDPRFNFPEAVIMGRGLRYFRTEVEEWAQSLPRVSKANRTDHRTLVFGHRMDYVPSGKEARA